MLRVIAQVTKSRSNAGESNKNLGDIQFLGRRVVRSKNDPKNWIPLKMAHLRSAIALTNFENHYGGHTVTFHC